MAAAPPPLLSDSMRADDASSIRHLRLHTIAFAYRCRRGQGQIDVSGEREVGRVVRSGMPCRRNMRTSAARRASHFRHTPPLLSLPHATLLLIYRFDDAAFFDAAYYHCHYLIPLPMPAE